MWWCKHQNWVDVEISIDRLVSFEMAIANDEQSIEMIIWLAVYREIVIVKFLHNLVSVKKYY